MTSNTIKHIRRIYAIAVTATTILAGLCLMAACLGIYLSGDEPYSPDAVAAAFSPIAIPVYLCLAVVILGFVLELFLPKEKKPPQVLRQQKHILSRLHTVKALDHATPQLRTQIRKEQTARKIWHITTAVTLLCGILAFTFYIFSSERFTLDNINQCVIHATIVLLICTGIPFGLRVASTYWCQRSMDREIALLKSLPKCEQAKDTSAKKDFSLLIPRLALLTIGLALLIFGFFTGGTADVLVKAINICTECVGLG